MGTCPELWFSAAPHEMAINCRGLLLTFSSEEQH